MTTSHFILNLRQLSEHKAGADVDLGQGQLHSQTGSIGTTVVEVNMEMEPRKSQVTDLPDA